MSRSRVLLQLRRKQQSQIIFSLLELSNISIHSKLPLVRLISFCVWFPFIRSTHSGLIQTCQIICISVHVRAIPAFINYVITDIRAVLINKQKYRFLSPSCLFFFFFFYLALPLCNGEQGGWEFDKPLQNVQPETKSVKRREAHGQDGSRVMRKADRSHERKFLGWETKSAAACPSSCSKDGWNKGGREEQKEDEWCERSVACWSIHERCREQKVGLTDRYWVFFLPFPLSEESFSLTLTFASLIEMGTS